MAPSEAASREVLHGQVVTCFGRRFLVEAGFGAPIACVTRGRRSGIVCGDRVRLSRSPAANEGVIEAVDPRTCLLYRSDGSREKAIAANVTQVAVVTAGAPSPNREFIDRCLAAAEHAQARAILVFNKADLLDHHGVVSDLISGYAALGYRCIRTGRHSDIEPLLAALREHANVLVGVSGVGKSTLVNRLVSNADARVGEVSARRDSGRHTTTNAQLYRIDAQTSLIDSPGMQAFGLGHIEPAELGQTFVEFRSLLGHCRFANCRHDGEPGCAIASAARDGRIASERVSSYRRILRSLVIRRNGQS